MRKSKIKKRNYHRQNLLVFLFIIIQVDHNKYIEKCQITRRQKDSGKMHVSFFNIQILMLKCKIIMLRLSHFVVNALRLYPSTMPYFNYPPEY